MKKIIVLTLSLVLLLSGCAPNFNKQEEVVQNKEDSKAKAIIPNYKISDKYYHTILHDKPGEPSYKPGETRGLVVQNINTRIDINEFETGLMRVAQNTFSTDKYMFQEGQFLKRDVVKLWLNPKFTKEEVEARGLKEEQNIGLNPLDNASDGKKEYLAHILEHNYYAKNDDGNYKLAGAVIGLALNSVYYYKDENDIMRETKIKHAELEKEGKQIAEEVLRRVRNIADLKDIPITIALFEQESKTSVVPGNFFAYANAGKESSKLGNWEKVDEKYYQFPSSAANEAHRDDSNSFLNFKQDVETYFPNFNGVIGRALYAQGQLQELNINIPIQFYGKAEGIGFVQYVTGLLVQHFPDYISIQVSITSVNGPEALIVRKADQKEPFVHIYQ
ncbi:CamS family sex pheromone protein [Bacillus sp. Bva_UNVM-123]|uniref:CamS family sex pheromone protein n=1 Tax=Bacillus sp. Bva_UNVM-123 TaxID=2829798 RepID=UPI00391F804C